MSKLLPVRFLRACSARLQVHNSPPGGVIVDMKGVNPANTKGI